MASITATLSAPLLLNGRKSLCKTHKVSFSPITGTQRPKRIAFLVKANGESSESLSIVKSVQNAWDKPEDRLGLIGFGFASVVALWASINLVTAVDKLPFISSTFEFIGILVSLWFTYRYLLFKPDREELFKIIDTSISSILGL